VRLEKNRYIGKLRKAVEEAKIRVPRTWKLTDGTHLRDLARHLPKLYYRRIASYKPTNAAKTIGSSHVAPA